MEKIFVSIASYRDPQTGPTIEDLLLKAKDKDRITIGLCLQEEKNETQIPESKNIRILQYNWRESQGTCWARHSIQKFLYDREDYYLQLDSHHRFCHHWDVKLIETIKYLKEKHEKPIIGGYCPVYEPKKDKELEYKAMQINCFPDFSSTGDLMFVPRQIKNFANLMEAGQQAIPARFLSGHFIFAESRFCDDCVYDPNLYFRGEELSLSARAYTHGYDMFHPTEPIVWHEYTRRRQIKHWDDHTSKNGFIVDWSTRSERAKERVRILLGMQKDTKIKFGKYGLGNKRTIHEYELYSGLSFLTRQVHKHAYDVNNVYPFPTILSEEDWENGLMKKYKVEFDISKTFLNIMQSRIDTDYIMVSLNNSNNILCYRQKINKANLISLQEKYYFESSMESQPTTGSLVAYNESGSLIQQYRIPKIKVKS